MVPWFRSIVAGMTRATEPLIEAVEPAARPGGTRRAVRALRRGADVAARLAPTTVWIVDEPCCAEWDAFVETRTDCAYATLGWRGRLTAGGSGTPLYLAALRGVEWVGILPLFETSDGGVRRLISLPGVPFGGLYAVDAGARVALLERAVGLARRRGVPEIEVRSRQGRVIIPVAPSAGAVRAGAAHGV